MKIFLIYLLYFLVSTWLMLKVGNSLHRNGRHWIVDLIRDIQLSDRINDILLLGYRLINLGYLLMTLMLSRVREESMAAIVEFLSAKLGLILMILAWLHFQNIGLLLLFSKLKSKYKWHL
ncbi:MAG TPA: hypothetical protein VI603_00025 [Saprospiraceae bacterium]|nr:hypothetical protein [Saprospiraceae bacterium]